MREIKFRAWDKEDKKYIKIENFYISPEDGAAIDIGGYEYRGAVIEQYTGLKDRNGVEIYENDILKSAGGNTEVVIYIDGRFEPLCWYDEKIYEFIGNVHQNQDLLVNDTDRISHDDIGNDIREFLHKK